jgi:prepilin-type N-terminal cleavage/methylation domain-containing protein
MNRRIRRGFTLIELLVVITIIGMLMALLLPAVQAAREAGRRNTCMNNQHQLSLAMLVFESAKGKFPGFADLIVQDTSTFAGVPALDGSTNIDGSWIISLLPYIERSDMWKLWSDANPMEDVLGVPTRVLRPRVDIGITTCPSFTPEVVGSGITHLDYVVNCGLPDPSSVDSATWIAITGFAADTRSEGPQDGVFFDHQSGVLDPKYASLDSISGNDGSSNTLMLGENINSGILVPPTSPPQLVAGTVSLGGYVPLLDGNRRPIFEADVGMVWWPVSPLADPGPPECAKINECLDVLSATAAWQSRIRPGSAHGGVVVASFCDGHQQLLNETMGYNVYRQIMTPNGKRAGVSGIFDRNEL